MDDDQARKCYDTAIRLLARREHARTELERKLEYRGFAAQQVETVLDELHAAGLQSDERFAQNVIRVRQAKGYGPVFVSRYLREKGVKAQIIESALDFSDTAWQKALLDTAVKKFGQAAPADLKQKARQVNFLLRRGFSSQQVRDYFNRQYDMIDDYENQ